MRKIHMVLPGIFAAGFLLAGIGTGIAFVEYSSLEYTGTVMLGEEYLTTEELKYEFEPVPGEKIVLTPRYGNLTKSIVIVVEDDSVPMGTICYDVTYNARLIRPRLSYWEAEEPESTEEAMDSADAGETSAGESSDDGEAPQKEAVVTGFLELNQRYVNSEFDIIMENKDRIMNDIKQHKLTAYETAYITDVKIRINPEMAEYIEDRTMQ